MNYRHSYHAGNFSDVFKHLVLITLLNSLLKKEKPLFYLDTHAGRGYYDLQSEESLKTKEAEEGIHLLLKAQTAEMPKIVETYLNLVFRAGYPKAYPGSPWIASQLLKSGDRLSLIEWQEEECHFLKNLFKEDKKVSVHHQNGYGAIKALLPPLEKRGLILIDPPFEKASEWEDVLNSLTVAHKKFPTGTYAVWYPIKDFKKIEPFLNSTIVQSFKESFNIEFWIHAQNQPLTLPGCGMLILNAPWQTDQDIQAWLPWLSEVLVQSKAGHFKISKLS